MLKKIAALCVAGCLAGGARAVSGPYVTLETSATNLIVSETFTATINVYLPPLDPAHDGHAPFLNQRPPHLDADFLNEGWKRGGIVAGDVRPVLEAMVSRNSARPVFSINAYQNNDPFAGMPDPFSAFNDPGSLFGPRAIPFAPAAERVKIGGVSWWRFTFTSPAFKANAPGRVALGPVTITAPLIVSVDPQNRVKLAGRTFSSSDVTVSVSEPPAAGRPATYVGAVGKGMTVSAMLDTSVCKVGDPLLLTVEVGGGIDLAAAHPPALAPQIAGAGDAERGAPSFRVDDESVRTETLAATRRFTYRVRALRAGTVEFPPLAFSYYDTAKRAYVTLRTPPIPVQAKAAAQAALAGGGSAAADDGTFPTPDGVDLDERGADALPLVPSLPFVVLLVVCPPLLVLIVRVAPPALRTLRTRAAARRRANALARCLRRLGTGDSARRLRAVRDYLTVRFAVNGAAATSADAERLMRADGVAEADIRAVAGVLAEAEHAEFSGGRGGASAAARLLVVFLALGALAAPGAVPPARSSAAFTWNRACALATAAADEADFRAAADAFAQAVAEGAANPVVFTDLGSCLVMAGEPAAALRAFAQAERYGGATPSTVRGVRAAYARLRDDPRAEAPLTRVVFRPHVAYSLDARAVFAAAAWAAFWLLALLPRGTARAFLRAFVAVALILAVVSVAVSLVGEHGAEAAEAPPVAASRPSPAPAPVPAAPSAAAPKDNVETDL